MQFAVSANDHIGWLWLVKICDIAKFLKKVICSTMDNYLDYASFFNRENGVSSHSS